MMKYYLLLFKILQSALWEKSSVKLSAEDIEPILFEAKKQAISPMVFQTLTETNACDNLPSAKVFQQLSIQLQVARQNVLLNEKVVDLAQLLQKYGIDYVIVKGQVVASYYPKPELRQSGDIDFFCNEETFFKAAEILNDEWRVDIKDGNGHVHDTFVYQNVHFEMHHTLLHFYNKNKDIYWESLLKNSSHYTVKINGFNVSTLHPTIHSLYIFLHLYHHLLELGVGLRQFCDWAMILHTCKDEIDHAEIKKHLKKLGLEKAYRACGSILVRNLKLPVTEFTYSITDKDTKYTEKILDVVFYRGNMGHYNKRSSFYGWKHKVESAGIKLSHFIKFYPLAPGLMRDWGWSVIRTKVL